MPVKFTISITDTAQVPFISFCHYAGLNKVMEPLQSGLTMFMQNFTFTIQKKTDYFHSTDMDFGNRVIYNEIQDPMAKIKT
jgi:hypothetical protein